MSRLAVLAASALVLAVFATATWAQAPASQDDLQQSVQALKERNRDLERRLADLEAKMGSSPEALKAAAGPDPRDGRRGDDPGQAAGRCRLARQPEVHRRLAAAVRVPQYAERHPGEGRPGGQAGAVPPAVRVREVLAGRGHDGGLPRLGATRHKRRDPERVIGDPTTTNQTFTGFQKYPIWIDQAYARWTPKCAPGLAVTAGKMPNPWETTDLVWDPDINPDGVWVRYNVPGLGPVTPFVGAGVFQLYASNTNRDASMKAYDMGARWQITKDVKYTSAVTFYNYTNIDSAYLNGALTSNNGSPLGGNTLAGGKLHLELQHVRLRQQGGLRRLQHPDERLHRLRPQR